MHSSEKPNIVQQDSGWDTLAEDIPIPDVPPEVPPQEVPPAPERLPEDISRSELIIPGQEPTPETPLEVLPSPETPPDIENREAIGQIGRKAITSTTTKEHVHDHIPSRSSAFLKAQAIAKEKGQHMVDDEKRSYIYSHEIEERVAKGEDINDILENTNGDGVWLHVEEFLDNGADAEKVFEYMPKDARWLRIDELVKHGYDINKLADKMSDTAVWLEADKFVKYGADINRLKQRLSSKDEYLKYLIDRGELFGSQN